MVLPLLGAAIEQASGLGELVGFIGEGVSGGRLSKTATFSHQEDVASAKVTKLGRVRCRDKDELLVGLVGFD